MSSTRQDLDPRLVEMELAHEPNDDPTWQESLLIFWADPALGVGGLHRIGHEPNRGVGDLWCGLVTERHRYRRDAELVPIGADDRTVPAFGLDEHRFTLDPRGMRFMVREPELSLDLAIEDFAPMGPVHAPDGLEAVGRATVRNHLENHGRATGRLTMGDEEVAIDAMCVRDHSWGPRDWSVIVGHRWVAGTFGPDLSFSATVMQGTDHRFLATGVVIRDGRLLRARDIDIVVHLESDGLSHRGGSLAMQLEDGTELAMDIETYDGWVFNAHEHVEVDTVCWATTKDGRRGICDLEVSNGRRTAEMDIAMRAAAADGLTRRTSPTRLAAT